MDLLNRKIDKTRVMSVLPSKTNETRSTRGGIIHEMAVTPSLLPFIFLITLHMAGIQGASVIYPSIALYVLAWMLECYNAVSRASKLLIPTLAVVLFCLSYMYFDVLKGMCERATDPVFRSILMPAMSSVPLCIKLLKASIHNQFDEESAALSLLVAHIISFVAVGSVTTSQYGGVYMCTCYLIMLVAWRSIESAMEESENEPLHKTNTAARILMVISAIMILCSLLVVFIDLAMKVRTDINSEDINDQAINNEDINNEAINNEDINNVRRFVLYPRSYNRNDRGDLDDDGNVVVEFDEEEFTFPWNYNIYIDNISNPVEGTTMEYITVEGELIYPDVVARMIEGLPRMREQTEWDGERTITGTVGLSEMGAHDMQTDNGTILGLRTIHRDFLRRRDHNVLQYNN